ncbi:MAG: HAMP domain-containing sensor histidine kinase [Bacteroidota bacterium]
MNTLGYYENTKTDLSLETYNLRTLVDEIVMVYKTMADSKKISLSCEFNHIQEKITTDKELFARVLDNIMSNAVKFSPSDTEIRVRTASDETSFWVHVKDQGPGFTEEDREKLYRKFQKLSARPTGQESSTGLGLSIVKTLIEKLRGSVSLETSIEGSEFTLRFPINY